MPIQNVKKIITILIVFFVSSCGNVSEEYGSDYVVKNTGPLNELKKHLLELPRFERISSSGYINYGRWSDDKIKLSSQDVLRVTQHMKNLKIDSARVYTDFNNNGSLFIELEISRSGFLNHKILYAIYSSDSNVIDRLAKLGGCSSYKLVADDWYISILYDDGVC